jgi:VWFA-related protein
MRTASVLLAACLCFSASALCQKIPASQPTLKQRPPADHRVYLDVVVTTKAGQPVTNLSQADFTLLDNDRTQPLVSFQPVSGTGRALDPGLQIIFVLDAVNNSTQRVTYARQQLERFFREDNGRLSRPTLVVLFTDAETQIEPAPTRDGNRLVAFLESNPTGLRALRRSAGFWGADERTDLSLSTLGRIVEYEARQPGRKLVVWLSSGWPLLSGPTTDLTDKAERGIFGRVVDLTDRLEKTRITMCMIDPMGMADASEFLPFYYKSFLKPLRSWSKAEYANLSLQVLAVQSGGRVLNSSNDLTSEIASCVNDAKAYYTLVFDGASGQYPDEYHSLVVKVDKPGLVVRTRSGYYAEPQHQ